MKIAVLVLGILGVLLSLIVLGVSLALPSMTDNRVSFEEAAIGVVAGVLILFISLIIAAAGIVLVLKKRKDSAKSDA